MGQVKKEVSYDISLKESVKSEPTDNDIETCKTCLKDHITSTHICREQNKEKITVNDLTEKVKTEEHIDIHCDIIKTEIEQQTKDFEPFREGNENYHKWKSEEQNWDCLEEIDSTLTCIEDSKFLLPEVKKEIYEDEFAESASSLRSGKISTHSCSKPFVEINHTDEGKTSGEKLNTKNIHTEERPFCCKICPKEFWHQSNLLIHKKINAGEKPFHCEFCSKSFGRLPHLKDHNLTHTGEKPFHCNFCSKSFNQMGNLKRHELVHTGEKPFRCKICPKGFSSKGNLKTHEKKHLKSFHCKAPKSLQCQVCLRSFKQLGNLKKHVTIHTGEKPFQCRICMKDFRSKDNLKDHQKTHTAVKPFYCKICHKDFRCKSNLNDHEKTHTGQKPFSCKICSKSFSQISNLKSHERIHSGERPFQCQICLNSFSRLGTLKKHEKTHFKSPKQTSHLKKSKRSSS
ncbi:uncharacterized protein [Leptinotarsa decemlineata]|uniref:uncharacterized protein n=1 Tax=Leptinotarsa decemlineata TaxID=7539 RepID=UPI003D308DF9